ncbi:MAG: flavin reductase family protein [Acetobacteraceae bacterium]|jgi:flavin reductase (DIM6/NTAB) family NADH-FMN oxidoreductase RutF|nr:flavin reductase family protein [Acetobacteraceae bacterium]
MREVALDEVYRLIEPGPVVLLSTAQKGTPNVMTMSWHMMVEFTPPAIACVVSGANHSFAALRASGECVIAIPEATMLRTVVGIGNCSGRDTDKFARFGLTALPAAEVAAPLIGECFANLECRVVDRRLVPSRNLFLLEVVRAWARPSRKRPRMVHHAGWGRFVIDGEMVRIPSAKA